MAVYLVTKSDGVKKNVFVCDVETLSLTDSIPGEYLSIYSPSVDNVINMNTEMTVYQANYFVSGLRTVSFICESSFDGVYQYFKRSGITDFVSINKTNYSWYEFR